MAAKERHDRRVHLIANFPSLIHCSAVPLVVEGHHALGRPRQVGDDEADAGIKLAWVPLDFRHYSAEFLPAVRLIAETGIVAAQLMRRPPNRALEQVANLFLKDPLAGSRIV